MISKFEKVFQEYFGMSKSKKLAARAVELGIELTGDENDETLTQWIESEEAIIAADANNSDSENGSENGSENDSDSVDGASNSDDDTNFRGNKVSESAAGRRQRLANRS